MTNPAEATRLEFPVKGMHCAGCVGKVERALLATPGVKRAVVNLATERATVELVNAGPLLAELRRVVAAAGYTVPEVIGSPDAEGRERALRSREERLLQLKLLAGAVFSLRGVVARM